MSRLIAKVCGLTDAADAAQALHAGADLLGFVQYPASPRHCADMASARGPAGDKAVLVIVDDDVARVEAIARAHAFLWVQPYVSPPLRAGAVHRLRDGGLRVLLPWPDVPGQQPISADLYLWETSPAATGVHGGSGQSHAALHPPPGDFLLAGGLDAARVGERIAALPAAQRARLRGADAASRLESSPGRKDPQAVSDFTRTVHALEL